MLSEHPIKSNPMKPQQRQKKQVQRRGETVIELLMTYVAPVVGEITASLLLMRLTGWHKIICIVIGIPVGTILGWIVMMGLIVTVGLIHEAKK